MGFPQQRPRRLRASVNIRRMVRENNLDPGDFIYPIFAVHGEAIRRPISSMPGIAQLSVDQVVEEARTAAGLGIPALVLFGIPETKNSFGTENYSEQGIVQQALRAIRAAVPELVLIADLCLCEYTDHGHCGIVRSDGAIDNDADLRYPGKAA